MLTAQDYHYFPRFYLSLGLDFLFVLYLVVALLLFHRYAKDKWLFIPLLIGMFLTLFLTAPILSAFYSWPIGHPFLNTILFRVWESFPQSATFPLVYLILLIAWGQQRRRLKKAECLTDENKR